MTAKQFRGTAAWKRARMIARQHARVCAMCGEPFRVDLGPRNRLYPTVDHMIELATLDLTTAAGQAMAIDQRNLRVVHHGCNASRGASFGNARRPPSAQGRWWASRVTQGTPPRGRLTKW